MCQRAKKKKEERQQRAANIGVFFPFNYKYSGKNVSKCTETISSCFVRRTVLISGLKDLQEVVEARFDFNYTV